MDTETNTDLDFILNNELTNVFRPGFYDYKGTCLLTVFKKFEEDIENFEVRDDDIWLASFPKSGTTWAQEMIWLIANNLDYNGAKELLDKRSPFLEMCTVREFDVCTQLAGVSEVPEHIKNSIGFSSKLEGSRLIKTHLPWDLLPSQLRENRKQPKIIYVIRNPKDVCISYLHHHRLLSGYTGSVDTFCKLFLAGKVSFGPYWCNVLSYWNRVNQGNILIVRYEDMKKDLASVIRQVATFLNKNIPNSEIPKLVHHLSFDQMKNNPAVNHEIFAELAKKVLPQSSGSFMRSGTIGNYKEYLTDEMSQEFDRWIHKNAPGSELIYNFT